MSMQALIAQPQLLEILRQLTTDLASTYAQIQKEKQKERMLPLPSTSITLKKNGNGELEVQLPEGTYPPVFHPTISRIIDVTNGFGFFGKKHGVTQEDLERLAGMTLILSRLFRHQKIPYDSTLVNIYQIYVSLLEAKSFTPESQVPEMLRKVMQIPLTPLKESEEEIPLSEIQAIRQRLKQAAETE
ncbi:MAG: hypothetical protein QXT31_03935 [Candidatus Bathyarchaeia archaeon]